MGQFDSHVAQIHGAVEGVDYGQHRTVECIVFVTGDQKEQAKAAEAVGMGCDILEDGS
jgi:ribosomal protein L1